jgi:hypothetical protein
MATQAKQYFEELKEKGQVTELAGNVYFSDRSSIECWHGVWMYYECGLEDIGWIDEPGAVFPGVDTNEVL